MAPRSPQRCIKPSMHPGAPSLHGVGTGKGDRCFTLKGMHLCPMHLPPTPKLHRGFQCTSTSTPLVGFGRVAPRDVFGADF